MGQENSSNLVQESLDGPLIFVISRRFGRPSSLSNLALLVGQHEPLLFSEGVEYIPTSAKLPWARRTLKRTDEE